MNKREIEILKIGFEAGKKAIEMHPDDDEYDIIRFEEAQERVKNLCIANVKLSLFRCRHFNKRQYLVEFICRAMDDETVSALEKTGRKSDYVRSAVQKQLEKDGYIKIKLPFLK